VAEKTTLLARGLDGAVRLTALYRVALAPTIQPVLVEEQLTMDAGLGLPLQGTIDVLTAEHWLPDLKTADKSKSPKDADRSLQLTFYAGLVAHRTGHWPKRVSLEVLVNTKEPQLQSLSSQRGPQDWTHLLARLALMLAQIETGLFPPCDPLAWICSPQWCGYFWTCTYSLKRR
jgi:hypothetical protein